MLHDDTSRRTHRPAPARWLAHPHRPHVRRTRHHLRRSAGERDPPRPLGPPWRPRRSRPSMSCCSATTTTRTTSTSEAARSFLRPGPCSRRAQRPDDYAASMRSASPLASTHTLRAPGKETLTIRATPCRHGPPFSTAVVGAVIGFAVTLGDCDTVTVWMTGDTVLHRPVRRSGRAAGRRRAAHPSGPGPVPHSRVGCATRWTEGTRSGSSSCSGPRVVVPVHYEGWSHFSESTTALRGTLDGATPPSRASFTWLEPGVATPVATTPMRGHELQ